MRAFYPEEIKRIHQHQVSAIVTSLGDSVRVGGLYAWRREYIAHDPDGNPIGTRRGAVYTVNQAGERTPQKLTIVAVEKLDLLAGEDLGDYLAPTVEIARDCSFRTVEALRDSWLSRYPRSPLVQVAWFVVGDQRDRPLFLNWTGRIGGDYVRSRHRALDEAEALTPEQMAELAGWSRQKDEGRRAQASEAMRGETLAQRVQRIETARERIGEEAYRAVRQNLRVIEQRLKRAERRSK